MNDLWPGSPLPEALGPVPACPVGGRPGVGAGPEQEPVSFQEAPPEKVHAPLVVFTRRAS